MKLVHIWSAAALFLQLGCGWAFAAPVAELRMSPVVLPAAPDPQMIATTAYAPSSSSEGKLYLDAGSSSRRSKADYTPPVDIFGKSPYGPFSHVAFGLTANTLGGGVELATPLGNRYNLRIGANLVKFQYPFTKDGVDYTPEVNLRSGQGTIDWFPGNGDFHISAGALYFRNGFSGTANVPPGQLYTLGGTKYINSVDDPVNGTATLTYERRVAPLVLIGFGNLIPRTGRRITFPVEFGVAYMGAPQTKLQLNGTSCTSDGCFDDATDPGTLANIKQEQTEINNDLTYAKFYPVVSLGFAFRF